MDNSLRDFIFEDIAVRPTKTEINDTLIGRLYTGCASVEIPDGLIDTFTFLIPGGAVPADGASEYSELVKVDQATKVRTTAYVFTPATCVVVFTAGNIPANGTVVTLDFIKTIAL